ncbi:MAG TPA: nicotinate phosphoribosyltransferase [Nitrososphaera sp.]|nr:nicotinate phosphoribosyltransferase [Nitrososphaera sp.]
MDGLDGMEKRIENLLLSENDVALATDLYELTMAAAYFKSNQTDRIGVFEAFVRKLPRNRSYIVAAGLEQAIHYLLNVRFTEEQIHYLRSTETFSNVGEDFFDYLKNFRFTGDVLAVPEGTVLFPNEPILRIEAPIIESQIVETFLLSIINFESLIATKASRITNAAKGRKIIEFGSRRAHGPHAALLAARASYIGGCIGTSNTLASYKLGIPAFGTMAHSFIMNFESEIDAFLEFTKVFPDGLVLVDTYDTLAAVKKMVKQGIHAKGIRLDSGDLYELSIKTREILDNAGYKDMIIMASGDLNEYVISDMVKRNAPIDVFGVGTELVTSRDDPAMNGVYKLVAIRIPSLERGKASTVLYKLKTSPGKKTYPGPKQIHRISRQDGIIETDLVALEGEKSPEHSFPVLIRYLANGRLERKLPSLDQIQKYHQDQMKTLPDEYKRLDINAEKFPVIFSDKLESVTREFLIRE